ncbi:MFS general substrate transporter [Periconia macrospinosa]|uniref:MFS general substrate transporter n=1 Tax=Periconia macrospinosa TaxID=97972 RepID=A0A2V1D723_9PLEO|nr:MFS general substrate transporter [Periconia macrospinosa]
MAVVEQPITQKKTRIVSVVAATVIALACGTNYAYSAWAPQFADKLQLSATQSNVIGTSANLGMYVSGIPMGIITDRKSPRLSGLIGMVALFVGYFPIHVAYDKGVGSMSVGLISLCSFISGLGSCAAFQAALKTATLNWPTHRGTASAFPLAAFGLSAFFYTLIAGIAFPGDTSSFLLLLSFGTSSLVLGALPFLRVVDHRPGAGYTGVPTAERTRRDSNLLHRTRSNGSKTSSRYSRSSLPQQEINITGVALLYKTQFWQLWILMGLLTGVGLMTINNIGHDVQALWNHYDPKLDKDFVVHRQLLHVSIISLCSFLGRLSSGIGSDIIVKKLGMSRFWCVAISATVFMLAQVCAIRIEDPHYLWAVSGLCGLAYGILFGVLPSLVVDAFGPDGFAVNWGVMTLAPVISGNVFNLFYGAVYDSYSEIQPSGERNCDEGLICYRAAYYVTLVSSILGLVTCFWGIRHEQLIRKKEEAEHEGHRDA